MSIFNNHNIVSYSYCSFRFAATYCIPVYTPCDARTFIVTGKSY